MHTDAGILNPHPPAPHRAILAPASVARQRAGGRSPTAAEINSIQRARAVRDGIEQANALREAEEYLTLVCGSWYLLTLEDRAVAIKHALAWLTVLFLGSPVRASVWLAELAIAAGIRKADLRREIENRADFWRNFNTFAETRREETVGALCQILF